MFDEIYEEASGVQCRPALYAYRLTGLQAYRLTGLQAYRLTGLQADDTTPTIHLDKFYTAANNRGALAILGYYGAVKQSSVDVEGVIAMKDKIKDLTKTL
ncbi:hypothetical protein [Pantoea stewartii]|uniref:hypothetical protein n=1 Tax=Pantoea stewartii TaxID=66269 RepID=UPI001CF7E389|nr:hypothetical protein [Pantoea stewartii]